MFIEKIQKGVNCATSAILAITMYETIALSQNNFNEFLHKFNWLNIDFILTIKLKSEYCPVVQNCLKPIHQFILPPGHVAMPCINLVFFTATNIQYVLYKV